MVSINLSDWSAKLLEQSLKHLSHGEVVLFDPNRKVFSLSQDHSDKVLSTPFFWLLFSTGIELFIKAVLIRHDCIELQRRQPLVNQSGDPQVQHALDSSLTLIVASDDPFIRSQFNAHSITKLMEINTPTLGTLSKRKGVDLLEAKNLISSANAQLLRDRIHCLAFIRRNVEAHIFMGLLSAEIGSDLTNVYLPMLNQLSALI